MPAQSEIAKAARKSIRKNFPLGNIMCKGIDNPITLHAVDDDLFARIWSVIAETMCVTVELSRTTKEAVATKVSESNQCPVCITAHLMMGVVSIVVEKQKKKNKKSKDMTQEEREARHQAKMHEQALDYADLLLDEMKASTNGTSETFSSGTSSRGSGSFKKARKDKKRFSHLNETAKTEVALVVMLFDHMNRVVSVIMGEEMSTAMFSVPRSMAKAMEKPSMVKAMGKMMSPLMGGAFKVKHLPGMTLSLFPGEENEAAQGNRRALPPQLQGLVLAGLERANAVGRLVDWVETFEKDTLIGKGLLNQEVIDFLDRETKMSTPSHFQTPGQVFKWVENCVKDEVSAEMEALELDTAGQSIAMLLMLSTFAPQTAYHSAHWDTVVDHVGVDTARSVVAWWSLRSTLHDAKGLDTKVDAQTMMKMLLPCQ